MSGGKKKDFDGWNAVKKRRDALSVPKQFRDGDIWISSVGLISAVR